MPRRLIAGVAGVVLLAGCGGSDTVATKTETTTGPVTGAALATIRVDSLGAVGDLSGYCYEKLAGGYPAQSKEYKPLDRLVDAYRASRWAPAVRKDVRDGANALRDCGEDSAADRLDRLADAH